MIYTQLTNISRQVAEPLYTHSNNMDYSIKRKFDGIIVGNQTINFENPSNRKNESVLDNIP